MKSVFTFLFLSISFLASAQNTFKTRLFSATDGYLTKTAQLNDGSIVSVGYINGDDDMWLVKTSAAGTVLASQQISTDGYDEGYSVIKTSDGGFAVTGVLNDQTGLLKFNADLSLQWKQEYDISFASGGLALVQTADGGYLVAGYVSNNDGDVAGSLVKTNSEGVIQFQKRYFSFSLSFIFDLSPTTDGNYAFLAADDNSGVNYAGKVKPDGTILWVQRFSGASPSTPAFTAVTGASDGGVVVSGFADFGSNNNGMLLVKFDAGGNLAWSKLLQNANGDAEAYTVLEDKDGGYLFAGYGDDDNAYAYVVKTTSAGALVWKKTFEVDAVGYTEFTGLVAASDGGFIATGDGYLLEQGGDYEDAGIVYTFTSGFDACGETAGTADGSLVDFGSAATVTLTATNTALVAATADFTATDIDNQIDNVCSSSLPVHLTSFTAALQGRNVNINWTTANEINADYFVVERSANRTSFDALQTVAAKGNSSVTQLYSANDLQPLRGTSYYRLKEVDKDGKTTYSSIVPVTVMSNGTIVISPNPVQNNIRVIVQSTASNNLTLQVVDMKGNVLAMQTKAVVAGRNEINIPASSLARGVYVLKVTDSKTTQAIRFVKE